MMMSAVGRLLPSAARFPSSELILYPSPSLSGRRRPASGQSEQCRLETGVRDSSRRLFQCQRLFYRRGLPDGIGRGGGARFGGTYPHLNRAQSHRCDARQVLGQLRTLIAQAGRPGRGIGRHNQGVVPNREDAAVPVQRRRDELMHQRVQFSEGAGA
jgi:hypothetical protein